MAVHYIDTNIRVVDNLCLLITYKGTQLRRAEQIGSARVDFTQYTSSRYQLGSCAIAPHNISALWVDIMHGGYPNGWNNICHWADSMFPLYIAASTGLLRNVSDVYMWQVKRRDFKESGVHASLLRIVLREAGALAARYHFDDDLTVGETLRFKRAVTANLLVKNFFPLSGCSRGLESATRNRYQRQTLQWVNVIPTEASKTILYISRARVRLENASAGARFAKRYGFQFHRQTLHDDTPYRQQVAQLSSASILIGAHGAGLVHIPLLQPVAAVIEMFNCKHTSCTTIWPCTLACTMRPSTRRIAVGSRRQHHSPPVRAITSKRATRSPTIGGRAPCTERCAMSHGGKKGRCSQRSCGRWRRRVTRLQRPRFGADMVRPRGQKNRSDSAFRGMVYRDRGMRWHACGQADGRRHPRRETSVISREDAG